MSVGDLYWVELPAGEGHEQAGRRPAIHMQRPSYEEGLPVVLVIPLTTTRESLRFPGTVLITPMFSVLLLCLTGLVLWPHTALFADSPQQMGLDQLLAAYQENPRNVEVALELGIRYHDLMRETGTDAAYGKRENRKKLDGLYQKSLKYLKRAQFMTQFGAVPSAYIGSLTVLRGRDVAYSDRGLMVRWRAPKNFGEGPAMIDQEIAREPDNPTLRVIRIADAVHIPTQITDGSAAGVVQEWVPRKDRFLLAVADAEWLIRKSQSDAALAGQLNLAQIHLHAGMLLDRMSEFDKSRMHLVEAARLGKGSRIEQEARALLQKVPQAGEAQ